MVMKMFITKFFNNLPQKHQEKSMKKTPKNWNFRMSFHWQCKYMLVLYKKNNSILTKNWSRNDLDAKDDPYEVTIMAYDREMDQIWRMLTWKWTKPSTNHVAFTRWKMHQFKYLQYVWSIVPKSIIHIS